MMMMMLEKKSIKYNKQKSNTEKIHKSDKPLARLSKNKRDQTVLNIRNVRGVVTSDPWTVKAS